ncbi:MAG TPA: TolC family protein [Gemmatimonadaceae bacterium]|nr:TolC family protein [Gemmatimonadaceae bacterium]
MDHKVWLCGLALIARAASAQLSDTASTDTLRLTRAQAIDTALKHNPQLVVAHEQVEEARAQKLTQWAIPDPTTTAEIVQQHPASPDIGIGRPINTTVTVPFPDKIRLNYKIGSSLVGTAEANYTALRQQIASSTAQTYDSLRVALRHHGDLTETRDLSADFLKKTQARFDAGTAPKLDVIRAQVGLAGDQNALIANERDITTARASLNRLLGRNLGLPVAPADSLAVPPPLPALGPIEASALAARPELQGLRAQLAGAKATTRLAEEFWVPDLIGGVEWDLGAPNFFFAKGTPVYSYGLSMSLPVFFWQHTGGDIKNSRHHERELEASYKDQLASIDQDVRFSYATAATALEQAIYLRDQLVPSARAAYQVASTSYGLGGSSALDVLDARRDLVSAESQYTDALAAANQAQANLERAAAAPLSQFHGQ